jgi:hypothetical protein
MRHTRWSGPCVLYRLGGGNSGSNVARLGGIGTVTRTTLGWACRATARPVRSAGWRRPYAIAIARAISQNDRNSIFTMSAASRITPTAGIARYISQILEAEATLAGGDHIVEEMQREALERRKAEEEEGGP